MQKLGQSEDTAHNFVDLVIYGRSGAGKTFAAATAPGPMYVVSTDPTGHKSIPYSVDGVYAKSIDDIRDTIIGFNEGGHGFRSLLIDGVSFIYDMYVREIGRYFYESMGAKDPDLMPIAGRLKIINQYKNMITALINLTQVPNVKDRVHVIFTTLDERIKEDDTAPFNIRPYFGSQKINEVFPAYFSAIGYITPIGESDDEGNPDKSRGILFTEQGGVLAKDRLGIFPDKAKNINLSDYIK